MGWWWLTVIGQELVSLWSLKHRLWSNDIISGIPIIHLYKTVYGLIHVITVGMVMFPQFLVLTLTALGVGVQSWGEKVPVWAAADELSTFPVSFPSRSLNKLFNYKHEKQNI